MLKKMQLRLKTNKNRSNYYYRVKKYYFKIMFLFLFQILLFSSKTESDITSMQLINPMDKTSILYRYLDAGGRYVAPTGNTLYNFKNKNDLKVRVMIGENNYLSKVIGVIQCQNGNAS